MIFTQCFFLSNKLDSAGLTELAPEVLSLLGTHPDYERRGAASKLVKWAFERADAAQLPCYVDSSMTAHALYWRLGFRDVGEMSIDLDQFVSGEGFDLQR